MKALVKQWFSEHRPIGLAIAFTFLAHTLDVISTALPKAVDVLEANPFARYPDGHPWIWHLIAEKSMGLVMYGLVAYVGYEAIKPFNKPLAELAVAILLVFLAYSSFDAALSNIMMSWGWFAPL